MHLHVTLHENIHAYMCICLSMFVFTMRTQSGPGHKAHHQTLVCSCCGHPAGTHGPAAFQDEAQDLSGQIQILTVGPSAGQDSDAEVQSKTVSRAQSKQDLRVTMLKKGTRLTMYVHPEKPVEDVSVGSM